MTPGPEDEARAERAKQFIQAAEGYIKAGSHPQVVFRSSLNRSEYVHPSVRQYVKGAASDRRKGIEEADRLMKEMETHANSQKQDYSI